MEEPTGRTAREEKRRKQLQAAASVAGLFAFAAIAKRSGGLRHAHRAVEVLSDAGVELAGVAGHVKNRVVGPGWSQHREIWIDPYLRGQR